MAGRRDLAARRLQEGGGSQANKEITPTNYKSELDSVEKELNSIK